jgi:hypothetical protein
MLKKTAHGESSEYQTDRGWLNLVHGVGKQA